VFDSATITKRKTVSLLEVLGAIGGLQRVLNKYIGMFVAMFTFPILSSLIGNKLYVYDEPESLDPYNKTALKTNKVEFDA